MSQVQRHSQAHRGANQEATKCVSDGIISYKSDLAQEPGLALIFEPMSLLALDALMTLSFDFLE